MNGSYLYSTRGLCPGRGAKMFTIAGPVLVYGTAASVVFDLFTGYGRCFSHLPHRMQLEAAVEFLRMAVHMK